MNPPGGWSLLDLASLAGTFVFALSGAIMAVRKRFDLLGVIVLGCVTAVGGGSIRDSLTGNTPPVFFRDERFLWAAILASLLGAVAYPRLERLERVLRLFDSLGLALFAGTGASLGVRLGLGPLGVIFVGALSGVGGGVLRDLLAGEVPQILYRSNEIYASAAALGSLALLAANRVGSPDFALSVGVLVTLGLRLGSERLGLALPVPAARDGSALLLAERAPGVNPSPGNGVPYAVRRAVAGASPRFARDAERSPMASLLGQPAPEVHLKAHNGEDVDLASYKGKKNVLLIFYFKDYSSVCSLQLPEFSSQKDFFDDEDTVIVGVSADTLESHQAWAREYGINVPLLADTDSAVARAFGVFDEASGKSKRASFLIDKNGTVVLEHVEPVLGDYTLHVGEVLDRLKQLNAQGS